MLGVATGLLWAPLRAVPGPAIERAAAPGGFLRVQAPSKPRLTLPSEGTIPSLDDAVEWPNVKQALGDLDVPFPVAVDNNFTVWRAFHNQYWPAHYFIDARGRSGFTMLVKANTTSRSR